MSEFTENQVQDFVHRQPNHHFRTEIPNIVHLLGLDPYEFRVYVKIKEVAGDAGGCWKSNKKLAEECGMSPRKFIEGLQRLQQKFPLIGDSPLIVVQKRFKEDGSQSSNLVIIVDVWQMNGDYFRDRPKNKSAHPPAQCAAPPLHVVHPPPAPGADKQDLLEEKQSVCTVPEKISEEIPKEMLDHQSCKKRHPDGHEYKVSLDEIISKCTINKDSFTLIEINEGWQALCDTNQPVRDPYAFVVGTIKKIRNGKTHFKSQGGYECKKKYQNKESERKESLPTVKRPPSEKGTVGQLLEKLMPDWRTTTR